MQPIYLLKIKKWNGYKTLNEAHTDKKSALLALYKELKETRGNPLIYELLEMDKKRTVVKDLSSRRGVLKITEVRTDFFDESKEFEIELGKVVEVIPHK